MGSPQLVFGLSLILLIQTTPSQLTDDNMMQKSGTWIRDVLQRQQETQSYKGTFTSATTLQNKPVNRPTLSFSGQDPSTEAYMENPREEACQIRYLQIFVRDIGFGYESQDTIFFKYCNGTCPKAHSNHDMLLSTLVQQNKISARENPCCRPIRYEPEDFMDIYYQWHQVPKLSASACRCVG